MPFVHAFLPARVPDAQLERISQALHDALIETFDVPPDDRFQVLTRHPAGELSCTPQYLGIPHSGDVVFIQIVCKHGRTLAKKRALYAHLAHGVARATGFSPDDVLIHVIEVAPENWSFGRGLAQLAPTEAQT